MGEFLKITDLLNDALNTKKTYDDESVSKLDISLTYKVFVLLLSVYKLTTYHCYYTRQMN